jgi:hypothetical protein
LRKHVATYFRHGRTSSRRAGIAHTNNEHPITHWMKELALDRQTVEKMLVYVGIHHTGLRAQRTPFYRLANLENDYEYRKFFNAFHSIPAGKKKFINYMANQLQMEISSVE